jgi:hypothetical protein
LRINLKLAGLIALVFQMVFFLCIMAGTATVSISGGFYNSDYSLGISETNENANSVGSVCLQPSGGDHVFSINAFGYGVSNNGNSDTKHSLILQASGNGRTVVTGSMLEEDAAIKPALSESWSHGVVLGSSAENSARCTLNQMIDIKSVPGYLTFPTAASVHPSTTTQLTFSAFDANGRQLFSATVPPWLEFGEPRLTLAVWPEDEKDKNVYWDNILQMSSNW